MSKLEIPRSVVDLAKIIAKSGGNTWVVGGAVRDMITGNPIKDIDLEVSGISETDLLALPVGIIPAGDRFGVWIATLGSDVFEVALPQIRVRNGNKHTDEKAIIDHTLPIDESLARRDFTMNAMAVNVLTGQLVDPFDGAGDIKAGILDAVSHENFGADPLRVLRGMQFCARFNLTASTETLESARFWVDGFNSLSSDRVRKEWRKWAVSNHPGAGIRFLRDSGWLVHFPVLAGLQGLDQDEVHHPEGDVLEHTILALDSLTAHSEAVTLAVLLHDAGKISTTTTVDGHIASPGHAQVSAEMVPAFLRSAGWQFERPTALVRTVQALVREHMFLASFQDVPTNRAIRRLSVRLSPATVAQWAVVCSADVCGRLTDPSNSVGMIAAVVVDAANANILLEQPQPIVTGRHLIDAGIMQPGRQMGEVLRRCFDAQLDGRFDSLHHGLEWACFEVRMMDRDTQDGSRS